MIYLGSLTKVTDDSYKIGFIHYKPFDLQDGMKNKNGMLKTQEELLETGKLVESLPECHVENGELRYNPFTNTASYVTAE